MIPLGPRLIALAILAAFGVSVVYHQRSVIIASAEGQTRKQQKKPGPKPKTSIQSRSKAKVGLVSFKHEHHRLPTAKLICSNCHTIPSPDTPDLVAAATKTSIKGYPYHDSCLECHRTTRPQIFLGSTPVICTVCHTRSSPRLTARDMYPFPKQSVKAIAREFPGYFPHREHKVLNCAACHLKDERASILMPVGGSETNYKPADGTFKTSASKHASCFGKCHWDKDKPLKDDCAGCHLTPAVVAQKKRNLLSPNAVNWFAGWPREWPRRFSLKFNHESKDHNEDCKDCHVNINQVETLDVLKAEVPITTCVKCHLKSSSPTSIGKEMFAEDEDISEGRNNHPSSKEGKHTCTGCHTTIIGSTPPPCSHYLLFDDTYLSIEDYPKSARQISERCKK